MDRKEKADTSRRNFLKLAAASAPAVAVAASGSAAAAAGEAEAASGEGLRETAHVKAYYESAKF